MGLLEVKFSEPWRAPCISESVCHRTHTVFSFVVINVSPLRRLCCGWVGRFQKRTCRLIFRTCFGGGWQSLQAVALLSPTRCWITNVPIVVLGPICLMTMVGSWPLCRGLRGWRRRLSLLFCLSQCVAEEPTGLPLLERRERRPPGYRRPGPLQRCR